MSILRISEDTRFARLPEKMYALAKLTQSCHNPFNSASCYFVVSASFYVTKDCTKGHSTLKLTLTEWNEKGSK